MTKLSFVADKARLVAGRVSEARLRARGDSLRALCEAHWLELRGPEPSARLAKILWGARPPLADLFMALHAGGDPRLATILGRLNPARGLALLVLVEIERGEAEEARCAYEAMMLFELPSVGDAYARRVGARLNGHGTKIHASHPHSSEPSIWKALAAIASETGRCDPNAVVDTIDYVARMQAGTTDARGDASANRLLQALASLGVTFLGFDRGGIHYKVRGTERKMVSLSRLAEFLAKLEHG
jgi:hypothetical protein